MAQMEREDPRTKVTARCRTSLKEQYQQILEDQGRSMSDDLREHMERVVAREGSASIGGDAPADPQLAEAYRALWRNADPDTHSIDTGVAETIAAEAAKVRGDVVKKTILKPLEKRDFLSPNWGSLVIRPPKQSPDDRTRAEASA